MLQSAFSGKVVQAGKGGGNKFQTGQVKRAPRMLNTK